MQTTNKYRAATVIVLMAAACGSSLNAQTVDSGSLLRQSESQPKRLVPKTALPVEMAQLPLEERSSATIVVTRFDFSGNRALTKAQLSAAVAPFLNTALNYPQLKKAAEAVTSAYKDAGWVARTYLPQQDITGGIVTIEVVEAVFGKASIDAPGSKRIKPEILSAMVQSVQEVGKPMVAGGVERALLLMGDLPGVTVSGRLVEGQEHGETDLAITSIDKPLVTGTVSVDNYGSLSTGSERLNANLTFNSPLGLGDLLTNDLIKTDGSEYGRIAYSLPLGASGARAGVHLSGLSYSVPATAASGVAQTKGLDFSYPLVRSENRNLNWVLTYDDKSFDDTVVEVLASKSIQVINFAVNAMQIDGLAGGGISNANLSFVSGTVGLSDEASVSTDASTAKTAGQYNKVVLSMSRFQTLANDWTLNVAASVQVAGKNLDSSEKIYLGGASGVRAYPSSEGGGSEGRTLSIDLQHRLDAQWTLTGFYDYGWIRVMRNNYAAADSNEYELQGVGASLSWQPSPGVVAKATLAQRIGENVTALDGDQTKKINRLWLNTSFAF